MEAPSAVASMNYLSGVPAEITLEILKHLSPRELAITRLVNHALKNLAEDDLLWKRLTLRDYYYEPSAGAHLNRKWFNFYAKKTVILKNIRQSSCQAVKINMPSKVKQVHIASNHMFSLGAGYVRMMDLKGNMLRDIHVMEGRQFLDLTSTRNRIFTSTYTKKISRDNCGYKQYQDLKLQQRDLETGSFITEHSLPVVSLYSMKARENDLVCLNKEVHVQGCGISILDVRSGRFRHDIRMSGVGYEMHLNRDQKVGISFQDNESRIDIYDLRMPGNIFSSLMATRINEDGEDSNANADHPIDEENGHSIEAPGDGSEEDDSSIEYENVLEGDDSSIEYEEDSEEEELQEKPFIASFALGAKTAQGITAGGDLIKWNIETGERVVAHKTRKSGHKDLVASGSLTAVSYHRSKKITLYQQTSSGYVEATSFESEGGLGPFLVFKKNVLVEAKQAHLNARYLESPK